MSLLDRLVTPDDIVLERKYYTHLLSYIPYLLNHPKTKVVEVTGQQAEKFKGDLYGLLDILSVSKKIQYLVCRMNGYATPSDYQAERLTFCLPSDDVIQEIVGIYTSFENS